MPEGGSPLSRRVRCMSALVASVGRWIFSSPTGIACLWRGFVPASPGPSTLERPADDTGDDDRDCMARIVAGDTSALRPIFDRWKLPLLSYFYRSLGSRADAEDLALQVFDRVYRAASRYRMDARFSSWLFAIARGELLHELRRRRRKPVEPVSPEELEEVGLACDHTAEAEEHLLARLQELPEQIGRAHV